MQIVSPTEYAKLKGVDFGTVYRRVKSGELDSAIVQRNPIKLDLEKADAVFFVDDTKKNRIGTANDGKGGIKSAKSTGTKKKEVSDARDLKKEKKEIKNGLADDSIDIAEAKRRLEIVKLKMAKVELAKKTGESVDREEIKKVWFSIFRALRNKLVNQPDYESSLMFNCKSEHDLNEMWAKSNNKILAELADEECMPGMETYNQISKEFENEC